jgi:hypothetical protein
MDGERMNPGFYKVESDMLLHSPTTVESAEYYLNAENPNDHEYPVDGWYWFDSEEEAKIFFNIKQ